MVSDSPRIIRIVVFLLVIIGLIWLIVFLFSKVLSGGNQTAPVTTTQLSSYARSGTSVELMTDGPIVVNQEHRSIRITVEAAQSKIELISGYEGQVIRQEVFPNTQEGYLSFLKGLDTLGYTKGNKTALKDERGQCPLQSRYVYSLKDNGSDVVRYWSTSCGTGNFGGNRISVRTLFQRQIPPKVYNEFMRGFSARS
ncbi:hypothetical protein IPL85_02475 [Candidatus Saccharibacteria bacterium]|nr:MAG: hypothetical protein IPL85_02475 [Candidatus Saccharibacteria bacterium]